MFITGYKLQQRLRELHHTRDIAAAQFDKGRFKFEDEDKPTATAAFECFREAEAAIAQLQVAQAEYNLSVEVEVLGEPMTLCEAVKRVGGAGRMEKMWRSVASPKRDRYAYDDGLTRNKDEERAQPTVTTSEATAFAQKAARFASALREAIAFANATQRDIEMNPALFE